MKYQRKFRRRRKSSSTRTETHPTSPTCFRRCQSVCTHSGPQRTEQTRDEALRRRPNVRQKFPATARDKPRPTQTPVKKEDGISSWILLSRSTEKLEVLESCNGIV